MKQTGFVLIASLIFLVLLTLLGLAMFNGFTLDEEMAGNLREKSRAIDAAQTAINSAEYWLGQPGNATPGVTTGAVCTGTGGISSAGPQVCSTALASPTNLPWPSGIGFVPPTALSVPTGSQWGSYSSNPYYYIQYLGTDASRASLYLVTGTAAGGNTNAVAVLQSVLRVTIQSLDLGNG